MSEPSPLSPRQLPGEGPSDRLDSWKDVAAYLKRDVSTVQRWEKREGMPVHRHLHEKIGSVYAFRSEVDAWWRNRQLRLERHGQVTEAQAPDLARDGSETGDVSSADAAVNPLTAVRAGTTRWARGWLTAAALIAVGLGSIAYGLYADRVTKAAGPDIRSLVVLPFKNLSSDPAQEFFADGMTEELTASLAQIRALRVVSRTSAMHLKGSNKSLPEIVRDLNVDAVLEGSVQRAGGLVRIRIQLVHAPTDTHLWAREYERELTDVLQLQAEVARAVAEEIRVQITPEERARMISTHIVDPAAHDEYLLGRYHLWKYIDEDRTRAIAHFERAIQIDSSYAAPYAGLSHAWWARGVFGPLSLKEVEGPSRAAARKALELDDRLAEAYVAQAYLQGVFDWDWSGAEKTIRHALELDPGSVDAHYIHAVLLMARGRHREAIASIEHAARLDPLSAQVQSTFGRILYRARRFDEALPRLNRAIALEPRNGVTYARLGDVYDQMGKHVEAIALYERGQALTANPKGTAYVSRIDRVYARMGRVSEARQMLRTVGDRSAEVHAALGDKDAAFRSLFEMVDERAEWPIFIKTDPPFDSLHSDARWKQLLGRMNLSAEDGLQ